MAAKPRAMASFDSWVTLTLWTPRKVNVCVCKKNFFSQTAVSVPQSKEKSLKGKLYRLPLNVCLGFVNPAGKKDSLWLPAPAVARLLN